MKKAEPKLPSAKVKSLKSITKVAHKSASTMDELMAQKGSEFSIPRRASIVRGIVTEVGGQMILVDIGAKTEGMITDKEFENSRDFVKTLSVGDEVEAYVLSPENDRGQILLSFRSAAEEWKWRKFNEWMRTRETVQVRGLEVNKGGIVARIDSMDIRGFIPTSQLSSALTNNLEDLVNKLLSVRVIEVNRPQNRLIFSEKYVSEAGEIKAREKILAKIKVGDKLKAVIAGLTDFGAFAKVKIGEEGSKIPSNVEGEVEGLIHISELSWEKIANASLVVKEGDKVEVVVIDVSPAEGKVGFSLKRLGKDPWENLEERYPAGKKIKGKVTKVASFGIFVQLEPGISGLLHISKVPTEKEPQVGDEIEVVIEDLDSNHHRLSLSMVLEEIPMMYR